MRLEGKIEKVIDRKRFLVRLEGKDIPQIGDAILSPDLSPIGKVADIIGNVDSPLALGIAIREDMDLSKLIGKKVTFTSYGYRRPARRRR